MKALLIILFLFTGQTFEDQSDNGASTRYIIIEAPCKQGFNALPDYQKKVILTKVCKVDFENSAELINAESKLTSDFEVALEKAFPNSRNQVKDIMVYLINSEKEAKELYNRKVEQFKILNTGIIDLKLY